MRYCHGTQRNNNNCSRTIKALSVRRWQRKIAATHPNLTEWATDEIQEWYANACSASSSPFIHGGCGGGSRKWRIPKKYEKWRQKKGRNNERIKMNFQWRALASFIYLQSFPPSICERYIRGRLAARALTQVNFDSIIFPISLKHTKLIETKRAEKRTNKKKDCVSARCRKGKKKEFYIFHTKCCCSCCSAATSKPIHKQTQSGDRCESALAWALLLLCRCVINRMKGKLFRWVFFRRFFSLPSMLSQFLK